MDFWCMLQPLVIQFRSTLVLTDSDIGMSVVGVVLEFVL